MNLIHNANFELLVWYRLPAHWSQWQAKEHIPSPFGVVRYDDSEFTRALGISVYKSIPGLNSLDTLWVILHGE
jgi:hypothetical protein